jgi:hypothetical protein
MSDLKCTICGHSAIGIAASTLGAFSLNYCKECLLRGTEPIGMIFAVLDACGIEGVEDWVKELKSYNEEYIEWDEICELWQKQNTSSVIG